MHCKLRAISSMLLLFRSHQFSSLFLMSEWREVVNRRLHRHEKQSNERSSPSSCAVSATADAGKGAEQHDRQHPNERLACRAALQVVPTALSVMVAVPMEAENGQPMQIDLGALRACQAEPQSSAQAPNSTAVFTWSEEKLLELATSLPEMRTIRHRPRGLRLRTCFTLKKLLQHHTHCHHQWTKRCHLESLQAEVAAARWAWLGPTLLVRAHEGSDHAEGMTPGQRRKLSIELAGSACHTGRDRRVD